MKIRYGMKAWKGQYISTVVNSSLNRHADETLCFTPMSRISKFSFTSIIYMTL